MAKAKKTVEVAKPPTTTAMVPFGGQKRKLVEPATVSANYVTFATSLGKGSKRRAEYCEKLKIKDKDLPEDAPILVVGQEVYFLENFNFVLTQQWFQHFTEYDDAFKPIASYLDVDESPGGDFKEVVEAVIFVLHDDIVTPAIASFRTTKSGIFHDAYSAVKDGEWLQHVACVAFHEHTGKASGRTSIIGSATNRPIEETESELIATLLADPEATKALDACVASLKYRFDECKKVEVN